MVAVCQCRDDCKINEEDGGEKVYVELPTASAGREGHCLIISQSDNTPCRKIMPQQIPSPSMIGDRRTKVPCDGPQCHRPLQYLQERKAPSDVGLQFQPVKAI